MMNFKNSTQTPAVYFTSISINIVFDPDENRKILNEEHLTEKTVETMLNIYFQQTKTKTNVGYQNLQKNLKTKQLEKANKYFLNNISKRYLNLYFTVFFRHDIHLESR